MKNARKLLRESVHTIGYSYFGLAPRIVKKQRGLRIVVYHGVVEKNPLKFNSRFLSTAQFESHLLGMKKYYNLISLSELKEGKLSSEKLNVLLTFDDGLRNNFTTALPLLIKYEIPAVYFITSENKSGYLFNDLLDVFSLQGPTKIVIKREEFVKRKSGIHYRYFNIDSCTLANYFHSLNAEQREEVIAEIYEYMSEENFQEHKEYLELMTDEDLKELVQIKGMNLASHGVSHTDFSFLTNEELTRELKKGREKISQLTNQVCEEIAFPYGSYNQDTLDLCKAEGYKFIFGTEKLNRSEDRLFIRERFTVNPFVSTVNQLYYIARNTYE